VKINVAELKVEIEKTIADNASLAEIAGTLSNDVAAHR
jgi:hypothetical protein